MKHSVSAHPATVSLARNLPVAPWPKERHLKFMRSLLSRTASRLVSRAARMGASRPTVWKASPCAKATVRVAEFADPARFLKAKPTIPKTALSCPKPSIRMMILSTYEAPSKAELVDLKDEATLMTYLIGILAARMLILRHSSYAPLFRFGLFDTVPQDVALRNLVLRVFH